MIEDDHMTDAMGLDTHRDLAHQSAIATHETNEAHEPFD